MNKTETISNNLKDEKIDWSLRANGITYDDNDTVSAKLTKRLQNSSASAIGIAGPRGAGKSSLALRVLTNCEKSGSFTQLIHSPTKYDPQEFLVSIFQTICNKVVDDINRGFQNADSISKIGKSQLNRLIWSRRILLLFLFFLFLTIILLVFDQISKVKDFIQSQLFSDFSGFPSYVDILGVLLISIAFAVILAFWIYISFGEFIGQRIRNAKESHEKFGLRKRALDYAEHLKFQTTLTKSSEARFTLPNFASKLGTGKSLAARPLSLPSLTMQFALFLREIGSVYKKGPVVICLDELDKIEDPKDLDKLLRGIKGILGQPKTHFLLTVSEDALSRFKKQRRLKQGILESAFEEIVLLDRVDQKSTSKIVDPMYSKNELKKRRKTTSTELLWLFGNALPREIKRNALVCLEHNSTPKYTPPKNVWKLLFEARMEDMKNWALRTGGDNSITYDFLIKLQESASLATDSSDKTNYDLKWAKKFVTIWTKHFEVLFSPDSNNSELPLSVNGKKIQVKSNERFNDFSNNDTSRLDYGRAVIEIILGASALVYVLNGHQTKISNSSVTRQLHQIFEFLPINLQFAWEKMKDYLKEIGITTK